MILEGQITRVEEVREGVAANGLPYCRRTVVVAFQEASQDGTILNQAIALDISGEEAKRQYVQFQTIKLELRFSVSSFKGRMYQDVRGKIINNAPQQQQQMGNIQNPAY